MGEVSEVVGGGTPNTSDSRNFSESGVPWITPADLSGYREKLISRGARSITQQGLDGSGAQLMPEGTVLFSSRAPIGYVAVAANPVTTNQGFKSFVLKRGLDSNYVYFYLKRARELAVSLSSGTTFQEISGAKARLIPIPVAPLAEQGRIVAKIEELFSDLDAGIAALERAKANLVRYRTATLKAAAEGKLTAEWRKKHPDVEPATKFLDRILAERRKKWEEEEFTRYSMAGKTPPKNWKEKYEQPRIPDTKELPDLPVGWCWVTLELVLQSLGSGTPTTAISTATSRRVLRSSAVRQGSLDTDDYRFLPEDSPHSSDPFIREGDLLFTRLSGSLEYVANCALVPPLGGERLEFPDRLFRGRVVSGLSKEFVQLCFMETGLRRPLERKAKSTAGHQRISLSDLRAFCLPLPPALEQVEITREASRLLSLTEAISESIRLSLRRSSQLRQSTLKLAFEGELVPQDPKDVPAKQLLERIRTERQASYPEKYRALARKRTEKDTV
jgi:type I restriction enzyme S subunit